VLEKYDQSSKSIVEIHMISRENETSNNASCTMPFLTQLEISAMGLSVVFSFICFITETLGEFR